MSATPDDQAQALHALLGIDPDGAPTEQARQTVALIRHPHTPWTYTEDPEHRLGALMTSPLALNLRNTPWQGLLANELTGAAPTAGPDLPLLERARAAGTSISQLITQLTPLIALFDDPSLPYTGFAPSHTRILFPALVEHAELWSNAYNEYAVTADRPVAEQRATARVLESLTDPDLPIDEAAHIVGQFREAAVLLTSAQAPQLLDGLTTRDVPHTGWPTWTATIADHLAATPRSVDLAFNLASDEADLPRRLRCGFRYWHVWGTYSQLYDELLTTDPAAAAQMRGYLYIGQDTGQELIPLPEITDVPLNAWELSTLFPELTALKASPDTATFAGTRTPTAVGLAPVLGELAELQALAPQPHLADLAAELSDLLPEP